MAGHDQPGTWRAKVGDVSMILTQKIDPDGHVIYGITVDCKNGAWDEAFGSKDHANVFLRGVWVGMVVGSLVYGLPDNVDHMSWKPVEA